MRISFSKVRQKIKKIAFYSGLHYFLPLVDNKEIDLSEGRVTFFSNNTLSNNTLISGTWIVKQLINPKVKQIISKITEICLR